ncbi:MAG: hypothetical protein KKD28_04235 [Chloroflexi bacterium]|nr:hypothetical protein [Chloroflexota bacterium]
MKPYEQYIPLAIAASFLFPLITITNLLAVIPILVLNAAFPLLTALGVTKVVTQTQEIERLVVG